MLKSLIMCCFVLLITCALSGDVYADGLRLSTGHEHEAYHRIYGTVIATQLQEAMEVELLPSSGSLENIERLIRGEADAAIIQLDVLLSRGEMDDVIIIEKLYSEMVLLIIRDTLAGGYLQKIRDLDYGKHTIASGERESESFFTWNAFCSVDLDYKLTPTKPLHGADGLTALDRDEVDGVILISGVHDTLIREANDNSIAFELADIDDVDFALIEYKGNPVYEFAYIHPKGKFMGLIQRMHDFSVKTVKVPVVLVTSGQWKQAHPEHYRLLHEAALRAIPKIQASRAQAQGEPERIALPVLPPTPTPIPTPSPIPEPIPTITPASESTPTPMVTPSLQVGDQVRVKPLVTAPCADWQGITPEEIGRVKKTGFLGKYVTVDFPSRKDWIGCPADLEVVR